MKSAGKGVREVRISVNGQFRTFYVTNIGNAVYVLHAFHTRQSGSKRIARCQRSRAPTKILLILSLIAVTVFSGVWTFDGFHSQSTAP